MESQTNELTLRNVVDMVARRRWLVIGAVVGCVVLALAFSLTRTKSYTAESEVLVQSRGSDVFQNQNSTLDDRTIQTQIQVMESQAVRDRVQQDLGLDESSYSELGEVRATAIAQTDVVALAVIDANASDAALYANAYATAYIDVRREQVLSQLLVASNAVQEAIDDVQSDLDEVDAIEGTPGGDQALADALASFPSRTALTNQLAAFSTTLNQLRVDAAVRTGGTTVIRVAEVPDSPDNSAPVLAVVLAVFLGLVLGLGATFLLEFLDDRIRTEVDLGQVVESPVLATVPAARPADGRPISISTPTDPSVEAYRDLRTNVRFLGVDSAVRIIQFTSASGAEASTATAANLAAVLAQAGHRVALVDANLRAPRVHEAFSVAQSPGFADVLLGSATADVGTEVSVDASNTLSVYSAGTVTSNPSELLSGPRTREVLTELGARFDYVIVASAAVLGVSDAVELSSHVDATVLVVRSGHTTREQLAETVGRLDRVAAPVVGMVLDKTSSRNSA